MGFKGTYRKRKVELSRVSSGEAQSAQVGTFEEDIRVLTSLKHPNVLACHGCYTDRERNVPPCRVVELAERGTLQDLLARGFLPHRHGGLFLWLALDLARALKYLHGANKLHRDVKAENVLVTRDWHAKLTGFSFMREQSAVVQTQVGTPFSYQDCHMLPVHRGETGPHFVPGLQDAVAHARRWARLTGRRPRSSRTSPTTARWTCTRTP